MLLYNSNIGLKFDLLLLLFFIIAIIVIDALNVGQFKKAYGPGGALTEAVKRP